MSDKDKHDNDIEKVKPKLGYLLWKQNQILYCFRKRVTQIQNL